MKIGIEEEFLIIDPKTLFLTPAAFRIGTRLIYNNKNFLKRSLLVISSVPRSSLMARSIIGFALLISSFLIVPSFYNIEASSSSFSYHLFCFLCLIFFCFSNSFYSINSDS